MGEGLCDNVKGLAHDKLVSIVMIVSTGKTCYFTCGHSYSLAITTIMTQIGMWMCAIIIKSKLFFSPCHPPAHTRWGNPVFDLFVCLFVLRLNVPVNNFSVMSGRSQLFLGLTSTVGS